MQPAVRKLFILFLCSILPLSVLSAAIRQPASLTERRVHRNSSAPNSKYQKSKYQSLTLGGLSGDLSKLGVRDTPAASKQPASLIERRAYRNSSASNDKRPKSKHQNLNLGVLSDDLSKLGVRDTPAASKQPVSLTQKRAYRNSSRSSGKYQKSKHQELTIGGLLSDVKRLGYRDIPLASKPVATLNERKVSRNKTSPMRNPYSSVKGIELSLGGLLKGLDKTVNHDLERKDAAVELGAKHQVDASLYKVRPRFEEPGIAVPEPKAGLKVAVRVPQKPAGSSAASSPSRGSGGGSRPMKTSSRPSASASPPGASPTARRMTPSATSKRIFTSSARASIRVSSSPYPYGRYSSAPTPSSRPMPSSVGKELADDISEIENDIKNLAQKLRHKLRKRAFQSSLSVSPTGTPSAAKYSKELAATINNAAECFNIKLQKQVFSSSNLPQPSATPGVAQVSKDLMAALENVSNCLEAKLRKKHVSERSPQSGPGVVARKIIDIFRQTLMPDKQEAADKSDESSSNADNVLTATDTEMPEVVFSDHDPENSEAPGSSEDLMLKKIEDKGQVVRRGLPGKFVGFDSVPKAAEKR